MVATESRKARGAFFTPPEIASYLVEWAIRRPADRILEPSCGEASFLLAAARRLTELGAQELSGDCRLRGVEIHEASAREARNLLLANGFDARIDVGDFFEYTPHQKYDAIVGNPPFVRYQSFSGAARARSLEAALAQGVRLSGLASSWAAFVVKSSFHLSAEGRLALVLPAELLSVKYAREIRRFLLKRFGRIKLVMFEERVFPSVLEEVVLLLAEGTGGADCFEVYQTKDVQSLETIDTATWIEHVPGDDEKWTPALITQDSFSTYRSVSAKCFQNLTAWGQTYLGAVTGNNSYFSLSLSEARKLGLPSDELVRISPPGSRHLRGLTFRDAAWKELANEGARCLLFWPADEPSNAARRLIRQGEERGIAKAYKCQARKPWWRVPRVEKPDLFLTYMNHDRPRLVTNWAKADMLNSLYGVRLRGGRKKIGKELLPIACLNSVTLLGSEIVGRAYGGGLLKMEPREADKLPVPSLELVKQNESDLRSLLPQFAGALRQGDLAAAVAAVDGVLLAEFPQPELAALRRARETLFQRRKTRGKSGCD